MIKCQVTPFSSNASYMELSRHESNKGSSDYNVVLIIYLFDSTLIGDTSLEVSPACHYHLPPTLLLNVLGQIAAFLGVKKSIYFLIMCHIFFLWRGGPTRAMTSCFTMFLDLSRSHVTTHHNG
jgi:hypothetical protein